MKVETNITSISASQLGRAEIMYDQIFNTDIIIIGFIDNAMM